jgi:hypothetical protein
MQERGERPGRGRPAGDRRPRLPTRVLGGQPGPQHRDVDLGRLGDAAPLQMIAKRTDITHVRANRMRRQPAPGRQMSLKRRLRFRKYPGPG